MFALKGKVLDKLFASGLEWTIISTAYFVEIVTGPWPGYIDVKHKKIHIPVLLSVSVSFVFYLFFFSTLCLTLCVC